MIQFLLANLIILEVNTMAESILFADWATQWLQSIHGTVKANTYEATYRNSVYNHLTQDNI